MPHLDGNQLQLKCLEARGQSKWLLLSLPRILFLGPVNQPSQKHEMFLSPVLKGHIHLSCQKYISKYVQTNASKQNIFRYSIDSINICFKYKNSYVLSPINTTELMMGMQIVFKVEKNSTFLRITNISRYRKKCSGCVLSCSRFWTTFQGMRDRKSNTTVLCPTLHSPDILG